MRYAHGAWLIAHAAYMQHIRRTQSMHQEHMYINDRDDADKYAAHLDANNYAAHPEAPQQ